MIAPFTKARFDGILENIWTTRRVHQKINWLEMEQLLADCLNSTAMTNAEKVAVSKEILDAFTRRGHFDDYLTKEDQKHA